MLSACCVLGSIQHEPRRCPPEAHILGGAGAGESVTKDTKWQHYAEDQNRLVVFRFWPNRGECDTYLPPEGSQPPWTEGIGQLSEDSKQYTRAGRFGKETRFQNMARLVAFPIFLPAVSQGPGTETEWKPDLCWETDQAVSGISPGAAGLNNREGPDAGVKKTPVYLCFPSVWPRPLAVKRQWCWLWKWQTDW